MFNLSRVLREGLPNPRPFIPEHVPEQPPQRLATALQYRLLLILPENMRFVGILGQHLHVLLSLHHCPRDKWWLRLLLFPSSQGILDPQLNHCSSFSVNLAPGNWPTSTPMLIAIPKVASPVSSSKSSPTQTKRSSMKMAIVSVVAPTTKVGHLSNMDTHG